MLCVVHVVATQDSNQELLQKNPIETDCLIRHLEHCLSLSILITKKDSLSRLLSKGLGDHAAPGHWTPHRMITAKERDMYNLEISYHTGWHYYPKGRT